MATVIQQLRFRIKKHLGVLFLLFAWLAIVLTNTEPGTWFLSWDTMASEFNPALNIERSITGAWQSFQGLGLLGGHGYSAQLFHAITQAILGLVIPLQYLRYAFMYLMLLTGTLGAYALIRQTIAQLKLSPATHMVVATFGALVYLLHPGSVQTFYVALEPFAVMYGLLPWALWSFSRLVEQPTAPRYALFFAINCYLSIIGFIPPLFITYGLFLATFVLGAFSRQQKRRKVLRTSVIAALIVFGTNAYWLGPVAYFTATQGDHYLYAKLNQITTTEFIYTTRATGNLADVALLKGYLFDSFDQPRFESGLALEPILLPWEKHLDNAGVRLIGYGLALLAVWGVIWGSLVAYKKRAINFGLAIAAVLTFSLLLTDTLPFSFLSDLLRSVPILNQAFRIPYSKLSMSASLFLSLCAAVGLAGVFELANWNRRSSVVLAVTAVCTICVLLLSYPSFQGVFLYPGGRVTPPPEYLRLIEYFNQESINDRIAIFPIYTFSGWDMYDWGEHRGYTGSGFVWYALQQPILSRSFDVWSPYNETYRLEMQRAVYSQDSRLLTGLFDKYAISHAIVDKTVFLPNTDPDVFMVGQLDELLSQHPDIIRVYSTEHFTIYRYIPNYHQQAVSPITQAIYTEASALYSRFDPSIITEQRTKLTGSDRPGIIFPFAGVLQEQVTPAVQGMSLQFSKSIVIDHPHQLKLPELTPGQPIGQLANITYTDSGLTFSFSSPLSISLGTTTIAFPTLPELVLPVEITPDELQLEIHGQIVSIQKNQETELLLNRLPFKQEIELHYFDPEQATPSAEHILVNASDLYQTTIPAEVWDQFDFATTTVASGNTVKLQIAQAQTANLIPQAAQAQPVSCTEIDTGKRSKIVNGNSLLYESSQGATSCDSVVLPSINNQAPALVHVAGKNLSGRNIRVYVENLATNRVDFEHVMTTPDFSTWITLPSWPNQIPGQYSLHFENRSYGTETARNQITNISVHPLPISFEWLSQIALVPEKSPYYSSTIWVHTIKQWGSGIYLIELNGSAGSIALNQAADSGWRAYTLHDPSFTSVLQSFLGGKPLSTQITVNNWAQGWQIPAGTQAVLVVHQAQLLLFAGLWLLIASMGLVTFKTLQFLYRVRR